MGAQELERCAYCAQRAHVTWVDIDKTDENELTATVAVCGACWGDGL